MYTCLQRKRFPLPSIAILEIKKRHGISLGTTYTYATKHKCRDFTVMIGKSIRDSALAAVCKSQHLAVLVDGSTDSSVVKKELVYMIFVGSGGKPECQFFWLKNIPDATPSGIRSLDLNSFEKFFGVDLAEKLVSICTHVDGAAVNLGVHQGLSTLLK